VDLFEVFRGFLEVVVGEDKLGFGVLADRRLEKRGAHLPLEIEVGGLQGKELLDCLFSFWFCPLESPSLGGFPEGEEEGLWRGAQKRPDLGQIHFGPMIQAQFDPIDWGKVFGNIGSGEREEKHRHSMGPMI